MEASSCEVLAADTSDKSPLAVENAFDAKVKIAESRQQAINTNSKVYVENGKTYLLRKEDSLTVQPYHTMQVQERYEECLKNISFRIKEKKYLVNENFYMNMHNSLPISYDPKYSHGHPTAAAMRIYLEDKMMQIISLTPNVNYFEIAMSDRTGKYNLGNLTGSRALIQPYDALKLAKIAQYMPRGLIMNFVRESDDEIT